MAEPASPISDPVAAWRSWISQSEQQWNAFLNQAMHDLLVLSHDVARFQSQTDAYGVSEALEP